MKKIIILFLFIVSAFVSHAQVTDSVFVKAMVKPHLYTSLPEGKMMHSDGYPVDFMDHIKKKRPFKSKPTLIITWVNPYCKRCTQLIDSILDKNIQKKFNVVLVNINKPANQGTHEENLIKDISKAHPTYSQKAISLYDTRRTLKLIDDGSSPLMFFMDKDLKIAASIPGFGVQVKWIEDLLIKVQNQTIKPASVKFTDEDMLPTSENLAFYTQTITEANGIYTYTQYNNSTKSNKYKLNFIKNPAGYFIFHKSSMNVPEAADLYKEVEICEGIKRILSSIDSNKVSTLKESQINRTNFNSSLKVNNFDIAIWENEEAVEFTWYISYPKIDNAFDGVDHEYYHIGGVLSRCLAVKAVKRNLTFGQVSTYTIREGVSVILEDDNSTVSIIVKAVKDANGKFNSAPVDNSMEYGFMAPEKITDEQFCTDVNRIIAELKKPDKSGILGVKYDYKYVSKINIGAYSGSIEETATYYRYSCYLNAPPDESGDCTKEFDRISAMLQACLEIAPRKNRFGEHNFLSGTSEIGLHIDSTHCTKMWIVIIVMK